MKEPYELGKTGLHDMQQIRRQIQVLLERGTLDASTWQQVLMMELLLNIYDKLDEINETLISILNSP